MLVDAYGNPISSRLLPPDQASLVTIEASQSTATRWDAYSSRPGYGLSPERLYRVLRNAEEGNPAEQCDLLEDQKENDGHLLGLVSTRIESVAKCDLVMEPGDTSDLAKVGADVLRGAIMRANWLDMIEHALESFWFGYSMIEPKWELIDGWWVPTWFTCVPHRRFVFDAGDNPRLAVEDNPFPGVELHDQWMGFFRRGRRIPRAGVGRACAWWSLFKRLSVRDWIIFAEKFGLPIPIGVYRDNAPDETRKVLKQAIRDIGEAGSAVMNEAAKIIFADHTRATGDATALHPSIVALCNAEMAKIVDGSILASDTGGTGSFALGKVHESRGMVRVLFDAIRFAYGFSRSVGRWFNRLNGMPATMAPPALVPQVLPDVDLLTRAKMASILANELGMTLDGDQLYRVTGFKMPSTDQATVRGTKTNANPGQPDPAP